MKIIAYSKVPPTVPFAHLGYLSASTIITKPIQGLLFGGIVLLVAGASLTGKWLWQRRKPRDVPKGEPLISAARHVLIGGVLLLPGILVLNSAYVFGEREKAYAFPERFTSSHIRMLEPKLRRFQESSNSGTPAALPRQEGEYDLLPWLGVTQKDAWDVPLRLRVTQRNGVFEYATVSAGPDRIVGTRDDITSLITRRD